MFSLTLGSGSPGDEAEVSTRATGLLSICSSPSSSASSYLLSLPLRPRQLPVPGDVGMGKPITHSEPRALF